MSVFVLSPVLKTLTDSISTDTIYAMTVSSCYKDLLLKGSLVPRNAGKYCLLFTISGNCEFCLIFVAKNGKVAGLLSEFYYLHHNNYYLNWLLSKRPVLLLFFFFLSCFKLANKFDNDNPSVFCFSFLFFYLGEK